MNQLFIFRCVPDKTATIARLLPHMFEQFAFGPDINATQGVIENHYICAGGKRPGYEYFLLIAATKRNQRGSYSRRPYAQALIPLLGNIARATATEHAQTGQPTQHADRRVLSHRPQRKHTLGLPITTDVSNRTFHGNVLVSSGSGGKNALQHVPLAMPGK